MIKQQMLLNKFLEILIVSPIETKNLKNLRMLFHEVLKVNKCLDESHPIPYHAITRYIYNYEKEIIIEDLNLLMDALETQLAEEVDIKVLECFRKFKNHISLASTQKYYIQKIASDALEAAEKAEKAANEADAQAKSTIANYISILGIFASIIFTLFGGVNLIGSTVKLLEVNSRWPYLTFIISLLMICLLTLLNMLVKWINSMSNLKRALETQNKNDGVHNTDKCRLYNPFSWDFYTRAVSFFLIILGISLWGMYNVNKENLFTVTNETTTKIVAATPPSVEPNNKKPSETVETTEVKKLTVTNKVKEDAREENKEEKTEN